MSSPVEEGGAVAAQIHGENGGPAGFHCTACGRAVRFAAYVYAHWSEPLVHTCECGQRHQVVHGNAYPLLSEVN